MPCNRHTRLLGAIALVAAVSACGTPREQCIGRNTQEYRVVTNLLAEVEGNLARGYAWDERPVTTTEWRECRDVVRDRDGRAIIVPRPCLRDVTGTERFRVPIDPASETRKRDGLRQRLAALRPQAEVAVRACNAAYPES